MSDSEDIKPNKMELLFEKTLDQNIHWLVLLHSQSRNLRNASQWLDERHVESLHHVIADDEAFIQRLVRFICGTATGLVASGGGAYAAAHLGCFKAFDEAGIQFDILGGASGGAAMIASVAGNVGYEDMLARTGEMMVNSKALKRYTVPRFGLVDHIYFDRCLQEQFGRENNIEDFWTNFFAVSTNLSTGQEELHRRGKIWKAVRASASIPGVLPPFIAENGDLLVDGGVINNVPLSVMKSLKHGPNIVLTFQTKHQNKAGIQYGQLPGRRRQLLGLLGSFGKSRNIAMPGIGSVLMQSMLLNNDSLNHAGEEDLILTMDLPKDIKLNDWGRYQQVAHMGYQQAKAWLQQHENHPVLKKIKKAAWVKSV